MKIYSLKDKKSDGFNTPQILENEQIALRLLKTIVQKDGSDVFLYPEDYALYEVGEWHSNKGTISTYKEPRLISEAIVFQVKDSQDQLKMEQ